MESTDEPIAMAAVASPELPCKGTEIVDRLIHRITDIDEHLELRSTGLAADMTKHTSDLGLAATAIDPGHEIR